VFMLSFSVLKPTPYLAIPIFIIPLNTITNFPTARSKLANQPPPSRIPHRFQNLRNSNQQPLQSLWLQLHHIPSPRYPRHCIEEFSTHYFRRDLCGDELDGTSVCTTLYSGVGCADYYDWGVGEEVACSGVEGGVGCVA